MEKPQRQRRQLDIETAALRLLQILRLPLELVHELLYGILARTLPWSHCLATGALLAWSIALGLDRWVWRRLSLDGFYPRHGAFSLIYRLLVETAGFSGWALWQVLLKRRLLFRLRDVFVVANLKNGLGKLPGFIFDRPVGRDARRLRLSRALLPLERFRDAKPTIESGLQVYVDEIKEDRETGTVDILYAHSPMPTLTTLTDVNKFPPGQFVIGMGRADRVTAKLAEVPHFLVAGETSSGKSTFLRQVMATLYLSNPRYKFTCIDLKGGLEFTLFAGLPRVEVVATLTSAVGTLDSLAAELTRRLELFAAEGVKDIDALAKKRAAARSAASATEAPAKVNVDRHVVVIDEIAELFLASVGSSMQDIQRARAAVSRLARQGRAVGLHLIIGTQRPDARALDTQIKANLPGKICFQMADHASSMVVLGNSRARELPGIPGRAIWQRGLTMTELQTPYLSPEDVDALLAPYRKPLLTSAPATATASVPLSPSSSSPAAPGSAPLNGPNASTAPPQIQREGIG